MIGKKLSPALVEIESALWEFEANGGGPPEYTIEALRAITKIFASVLMDKMWVLQETEGMDIEDRAAMATKVGEDIRLMVKTFTNIDTYDLYK